MGFFNETIAAFNRGEIIRRARLVELDFTFGTRRLWEGHGTIVTQDGTEWYGAGELGSIGDIESQSGTAATQVTLTLSGIQPKLIAAAKDQSTYYERDATIYCQHFDENWNPLDRSWSTYQGSMYSLDIATNRDETRDDRTINLILEGLWTKRGFSNFAYYSDREQKRFSPDDRGAEFISQMQAHTITWPTTS
jgi:hypothetical protein